MTPATILEHDGMKQPITDWALDYGITPAIIIARLERGMAIADAIIKPMKTGYRGQRLPIFSKQQVPPRKKRTPSDHPATKTFTHDGNTLSLSDWAQQTGLKVKTLQSRLRKGWSLELALSEPTGARLGNRAHRKPGVVFDFPPSKGTGAGSTLQATINITFSEKA